MNNPTHRAQPSSPSLAQLLSQLGRDESGQDLIEYAMVAGAMGVLAVASFRGLGNACHTIIAGFSGSTH
jgi:Flp pilus assembly pilin Flp